MNSSKTALVMEGGGLRGVFTAGGVDCLLDNGIRFDYVVGVSAGACNTFAYVGEAKRYIRSCMIQKNRFESFYGLPQMIESHKYIDLDKVFDDYTSSYGFDMDRFLASDIKWDMVVSNIETGKAEYMHSDDAARCKLIGKASCSLPFITSPVDIDGTLYMDGGICDSIPIQRAIDMGCEKFVVILTRKKGNYSATSDATRILAKGIYDKYPNFIQALIDRTALYRRQVEQVEALEREGRLILIRPTMKEVGRMESDEDELSLSYYHGYTKTKEVIQAIAAMTHTV